MEKETELYLINRIKDLETQLSFYKGFYDGTLDKGKEFKAEDFKETCAKNDLRKAVDNHFIAEYQGHDVNKMLSKSQAFDKLVKILGIEAINWADEKRYELKSHITSQIIDKETFKELWGAIND